MQIPPLLRIDERECLGCTAQGDAAAYTGRVLRAITSAVGFWWKASAGYRLRPWRSPYLRWRLETYSGKKAESLRLRDFVTIAVKERRQVGRFFRWTGELARLASGERMR